jgi:hypothetical protein
VPHDLAPIRRLYELGLPLLFLAVAWRSWRTRGAAATARELGFGFVVSQGVELLAVALGRYRYPDWLVYLPARPAWVPLGVGLGWAALMPVVMRLSERIAGSGASAFKLAALEGAMAVGLDLVVDPAVSGEPLRMWVWRGEGMTPYRMWLLGVPVLNFVGWFVLVAATSVQLRALAACAQARRRWAKAAAYLVVDLAVAWAVMQVPW